MFVNKYFRSELKSLKLYLYNTQIWVRLNIKFCIFYYFFLISLYQKIITKHISCESNQEVTWHSGLRWWINHWWYHLMRLCDLIWREENCPNQEASYVNVRADSSEDTELSAVSSRVIKIYGFISGNMFPRGHIIDTNAVCLIKKFYHLLLRYPV